MFEGALIEEALISVEIETPPSVALDDEGAVWSCECMCASTFVAFLVPALHLSLRVVFSLIEGVSPGFLV